jgi:CRISPR-associated protein Cas2
MTVVVASDVPPAVRGMLKRWFLEPRPNVYVGTLNPRIAAEVVSYARRLAPEMSLLVIRSANNSQSFVMEMYGQPDRRVVDICGLQLIAEQGADAWPASSDLSST